MQETVRVGEEVADALAAGRGVVALESSIIAQGLPRPENLTVGRELEAIVRDHGGVPATVGVVGGVATVGMDDAGLARLANGHDVAKLSVRDLPVAVATGRDGATTVAATAALAERAGIGVFATGGIGGVHRQARDTWDESADLPMLARSPLAVVCAGVKSVLDVRATLERLETLGVTVLGYRTERFPGFYLGDSGEPVSWSVSTPEEAADVLVARHALDVAAGAVVVANPLPPDERLDRELHDRVLAEGLDLARRRGVVGKDVTPFLLEHFHAATGGESLRANIAIVRNNARLATLIAGALARRRREGGR